MASNRELAERFAQTLTDHDLAGFAELLHPDYVNHNRFAQPGKDGSVAIFAAFLDAFEGFESTRTTYSRPATASSGATHTVAATRASSLASHRAGQRSRCTRSTSGAFPTASWLSIGTSSTPSSSSSRSAPYPPSPSSTPHRSAARDLLSSAGSRAAAPAHHRMARLCRAPG